MKKNIKNKKRKKSMNKNNIILISALLIITITIFSTGLKDLTGRQVQLTCSDNADQTTCEADANCEWDDTATLCEEMPACDPACTDPTPICSIDTCVQCLDAADCNQDEICTVTGDCEVCDTTCQLQMRFCYLKDLIGEITDDDYVQLCE